MRALIANVLLMIAFALANQRAIATDVGYQLDAKPLAAAEESNVEEPFAIEFKERVWSVPGIEQTSKDLLPPKKFDFKAPKQFYLEAADACRTNTSYLISGGPEWLDDVAWPLTRELYGLGRPPYEGVTRDAVFTFGGIGLQR